MLISIGLIGLCLISCAKKALPHSPDRFAPHLEKIDAVNRTKIDLVFDEMIDVSKLNPQNFLIVSATAETLHIRTISSGKKSDVVSLFTLPAKPEIYTITGLVSDRYGNIARINKRFRGSAIIDSIPPKIVAITPASGTLNLFHNIKVEVNFSEPMDTSKPIKYLMYPLEKNKMRTFWRSDWKGLYFSYLDSLLPHTTVYFILLPYLSDLEGNHLKELGYTFFTSDSFIGYTNQNERSRTTSSFSLPLISGTLTYHNQPIKNGIVVFSSEQRKSLTISDVAGNFSLRLYPAHYQISAIADTNFDQKIDLFVQSVDSILDSAKTIKLNLMPATESILINDYLQSTLGF
ncbi:MAG: Ig-like domain-containing protein [candidate division WOR-3 bacterium]|nr:Ig-like domain-containing protein [candidate division WOR-3 bacterium]